MNWILLVPVGHTVAVHEADIDTPVLTTTDKAETTIRRIALERELAMLRAQEGTDGWVETEPEPVHYDTPAPVRVPDEGVVERAGADGIVRRERLQTFQHPGPSHVCFCEQVFHDKARFDAHKRACTRYAAAVAPGGRDAHEPGSHKWGNTVGRQA